MCVCTPVSVCVCVRAGVGVGVGHFGWVLMGPVGDVSVHMGVFK